MVTDKIKIKGVSDMKISIIGTGRVGSSIAFALLHRDIKGEIVLVDNDLKKLGGEYLDLSHAARALASGLSLTTGVIGDTAGSDYVIIAAGRARKPTESMGDLIKSNTVIIAELSAQAATLSPDAKCIMVTNPAKYMMKIAKVSFDDIEIPDFRLDRFRKMFYGNGKAAMAAGQNILELKGYTNWGVAATVAGMIK